jgi:hypothetical protein
MRFVLVSRLLPTTLSLAIAPPDVPLGEHVAIITISTSPIPEKLSRIADLPVYDTPWDGSISLRREEMYGDDGR